MRTRIIALTAIAALILSCAGRVAAQNDNPTGPAGQFNGNSTTGGSYDPYTGNATRTVVDLTVGGAVGAYPLQWARTMNSRQPEGGLNGFGNAGGWRHSYNWTIDDGPEVASSPYIPTPPTPTSYSVNFPDGRRIVFTPASGDTCFHGPPGISQRFQPQSNNLAYLMLADGGKVEFTVTRPYYHDDTDNKYHAWWSYQATGIIDANGLRTDLIYNTDGTLFKVKEPAGRWLQITYAGTRISRVDARYGSGTTTQSVTYGYATQPFVFHASYGDVTVNYTVLTSANYLTDAGTPSAGYTYQSSNTAYVTSPLIATCDDPHYAGPMKKIAYDFEAAAGANYGQLKQEKHPDATGDTVVTNLAFNGNTRIETRGGGPIRTWTYGTPMQSGYSVPLSYQLADVTDFLGHHTSFSYDDNGFQNTIRNGRGAVTSFSRLALTGKISSITLPADDNGAIATVHYGYDDPSTGYYMNSTTNERNFPTSYHRDANHRVDRIDYPDTSFEAFLFGNFGRVTRHQLRNGAYVHYTIDSQGLKSKEWNPTLSATPIDAEPKTVTEFYPAGHAWENYVWKVTDQLGNPTTYEYERNASGAPVTGRGLVTKVIHADTSYAQYAYDTDGTLAWSADENHPNAATNESERTRYEYDDYKRVLKVTNPMNEVVTNYYGLDWANPYAHTTNNVKYTLSAAQKNVVFDYDANLRKHAQTIAASTNDAATTYFDYDEVGNLKSITDPRWKVTSFGYDARNRQTSVTDPLLQPTTTTYDAAGNKSTVTRPNNPPMQFTEYDSMNHLKRQLDERGILTRREYDSAGNLHDFYDGNDHHYEFHYDLSGRQSAMIYPDLSTEEEVYDAAGNPATYKNRAGAVQTFAAFDNRNRPTSFSWSDGTQGQSWVFDDASRVKQISNAAADVFFDYDDANRKTAESETIKSYGLFATRGTSYQHYADGQLSRVNYPEGYQFIYEYTQRDQLEKIKLDPAIFGAQFQTPVMQYGYDLNGNRTNRTAISGAWAEYGIDDMNQVANQTNHFANGVQARYDYGFDALRRRKYEQRDADRADGFQYDSSDQVTGYQPNGTLNPDGTVNTSFFNPGQTIGYDPNGNRTWYGINNLNQYTSDPNGGTYDYDANGNLKTAAGWTYTYDAQNRLVQMEGMNSATAQWETIVQTYDALNRVVTRTVNGELTQNVWDGWNLIAEHRGDWSVKRCYLHGANQNELVAAFDGGEYTATTYWQDGRGNTAQVTGDNAVMLESYRYDLEGGPAFFSPDWGGMAMGASSYDVRFLFAGSQYLPDVGLYDMRNRFYYPSLNRFLQPDPIGFSGDPTNLYRYCGGDPVNKVDFDGKDVHWYSNGPGYKPGHNWVGIPDPSLNGNERFFDFGPADLFTALVLTAGPGHWDTSTALPRDAQEWHVTPTTSAQDAELLAAFNQKVANQGDIYSLLMNNCFSAPWRVIAAVVVRDRVSSGLRIMYLNLSDIRIDGVSLSTRMMNPGATGDHMAAFANVAATAAFNDRGAGSGGGWGRSPGFLVL